MKSFIVFNREKDSDTFFPVPVRNREFLVRSSIHMEKNKTWSSVVRVRELEDQIFSPEKNEKSKRPLKEKRTSGKKLFKRTNELFFPLVLVLFLGIVAFAIGRHMEAKVPHNTPGGISKNSASNIAVSGQIINTTHLNPDSISLHEKSTLNGLVTTSTFQSNKNGALDKGYYREHWGKFMILSNSTYKHKFLGGIKDLSIMFTILPIFM